MKIFNRMRQRIFDMYKCQSGLAFIEFAICASLLVFIFLGTVEISRYILIIQKLEKTVFTVADVSTQYSASQNDPLTAPEFQGMMSSMQYLMSPYSFNSNGYIVETDIVAVPDATDPVNNPPTPTVEWQQCGGGTLAAHSKFTTLSGNAAIGQPANISAISGNFTMNNNEEIVVAEIFYQFNPIIAQSIAPSILVYRNAVYSPRLGGPSNGGLTCP